ncbi:hypothetical protein PAXRUDRAFT_105608, partial [Paxillus rubicundulus Ve08.2h10]
CLLQYTALLVSIITSAVFEFMQSTLQKDPEPCHTLILSGQGWVMELFVRNPGCNHCEFNMHTEVFSQIITELHGLGHTDLKFLLLEEQLTI